MTAVPLPCAENWKQVQCGDTEEAVYEQGQQTSTFSLQVGPLHGGKGSFFLSGSTLLLDKFMACLDFAL